MGLDAVEFVLAVEDAFGISISDEQAAAMATPRHFVDYLVARLPSGDSSACFSQCAFYRIRAGIAQAHGVPREEVTPRTPWKDILPQAGRGRSWRHMQTVVGVPRWPWQHFLGYRLRHARTVGDTAEYLAARTPHLFKVHAKGWSRPEIERVLSSLIANELGINEFGWDDSFVQDLGFS